MFPYLLRKMVKIPPWVFGVIVFLMILLLPEEQAILYVSIFLLVPFAIFLLGFGKIGTVEIRTHSWPQPPRPLESEVIRMQRIGRALRAPKAEPKPKPIPKRRTRKKPQSKDRFDDL